MADGTYAIKGLPRPADAVNKTKKIPYVTNLPVRYEISAFAGSKDKEIRKQWTLYVLALERFKTKPVDEKLSYFQVAGIVSDSSKNYVLATVYSLTAKARIPRDGLGQCSTTEARSHGQPASWGSAIWRVL